MRPYDPSSGAIPGGGIFERYLRSLKSISITKFILVVHDFHPFHTFFHEELDELLLLHFYEK
jgi:hypothetical protein